MLQKNDITFFYIMDNNIILYSYKNGENIVNDQENILK